jgi:phosphotransferase system  glucose/maltose/N-acetylglucosamine-specific IIC component
MKLWVIGILAFVLFWISLFLSDYILKHIKRPKIVGFLFILLAVLIGFEFYDQNQMVAGASVFIGFAGARILMKL